MGKAYFNGHNPNKNPGGIVRGPSVIGGGNVDAHKGRDHTDLTQLKSLEAIKRADFRGCYGEQWEKKLYETFDNLHKEGILEFITDPKQLTKEEYATWSIWIDNDGSMIKKSPEELAKAHGIFAIKQKGILIAAIGAWAVSYKPLIGNEITIYQRGSLVVGPQRRRIELGSYSIDHIHRLYQAYPIYSITKVESVAEANKIAGSEILKALELQKLHNAFFNRLEKSRGNFDYHHDEDDEYLGHYIAISFQLQQILKQNINYIGAILAGGGPTPTPDAQGLSHVSDILQGDVVLEGSN